MPSSHVPKSTKGAAAGKAQMSPQKAGPNISGGRSPAKQVKFTESAVTNPSTARKDSIMEPSGDAASEQLLAEQQASGTPASVLPTSGKQTNTRQNGRTMQKAQKKKPAEKTEAQKAEDKEDIKVMEALAVLQRSIEHFCDIYFNFEVKGPIEPALATAPEELICYAGSIALGGPGGREGWLEVVKDPSLRKALVHGIISRVCLEYILTSLCFGGDKPLIDKLSDMELEAVEKDGFYRARQRAVEVEWFATNNPGKERLQQGTRIGCARLTMQMQTILLPVLKLDPKQAEREAIESRAKQQPGRLPKEQPQDMFYAKMLMDIVTMAAEINILIRRNADVVYHFQPVFKDEEFDPERMVCQNLADMQAKSPWDSYDWDGKPRGPNNPRGDPTDVCLVRVVCSFGCVAFRKGGGDLGKRLLKEDEEEDAQAEAEAQAQAKAKAEAEAKKNGGKPAAAKAAPIKQVKHSRNVVYGRVITAEDGFRSKVIAKALVALRYGKPQMDEEPSVRSNYKELDEVMEEIRTLTESKEAAGACLMM